jgi:propanol-preferring alcohol dehydrogenase
MTMKAMILTAPGKPLELRDIPTPKPEAEQILIKIRACGVCRTDLHIYDGELNKPKLPLVMGHEIVGEAAELGLNVKDFKIGERIGVPWLGWTCGECKFCKSGRENLCDNAKFTGYTIDGGYAEYTVADQRYCFKIPNNYNEYEASPLLCAGLIGYRSFKMCGSNVKRLGIYGFGAAAHIIAQIAVHKGIEVYAFTRKGDSESQSFAKKLGAVWAGSSDEVPPVKLDATIIFAPAGSLVPAALKVTEKGGVVVCGGIHMSNVPEFEYKLLWEEREIKSVANLTRADGEELLEIAPKVPVKTEVQLYNLEDANKALNDLRIGKVKGAAVLKII